MSDFKIEQNDVYRIFTTDTGYKTQIAFNIGSLIRPDSEIKVECGCKSFVYEFSSTLKRYNGLLYPDKYISGNKIGTLTGCKHLIFFAKYIFERRSIFDK